MEASVYNLLSLIKLGEAQRHQNVTITPLFGGSQESILYTTLSKALTSEHLTIKEISENGSVPELRLISALDEAVLLIDGEELAGAKQNRVLNASILAAAHSELLIPVSCTESGRWSYTSDRFSDSDVVMTARHRAAKSSDVRRSLERESSYRSDQDAVWSRVDEMQDRLGVESRTAAMKDAFSARRPQLESFTEAFPYQSGQKGLAVAVDGRLLGFEYLSRSEAYADLHSKLVRSYAMEALLEPAGATPAKDVSADVAAFIERLVAARETKHKSVGLGWDYRYDAPDALGSALVVDDEPVHVAFFRADGDSIRQDGDRMASFARRSRFRSQGEGDQ